MRVIIRINRSLYESIRTDLLRPHDHAYERVGFVHARIGIISDHEKLVLFSGYHSVPDENYLRDEEAGARIDSSAIRNAMQRSMDTGKGMFHVHLHNHVGIPGLSLMDETEIPPIISSLRVATPQSPHGIFLLSKNKSLGLVWLPGISGPTKASKISIIGYPIDRIWNHSHEL